MNNIFRLYNQNKATFWTIILIIIFVIFIIHLLNYIAEQKLSNNDMDSENITNSEDTIQSRNEVNSKPIISGSSLSSTKKEKNLQIINDFLDNCINNNIEKAYNMLSSNCKEVMYDSLDKFNNLYCKRKFKEGQTYDVILWNSNKNNVYQIKIFENMLSSGVINSSKYIEDFYTVVNEEGEYKLNINGYINRNDINENSDEQNNLNISVKHVDMFKEYYIYTIKIKNNTQNDIILDTRKNTNSTYVTNSHNVKFIGLLYENLEKDLLIEKGQEKTIKIKFNINYREDISIKNMVFSDIVMDANKYKEDKSYSDRLQIKIDI